MRITVEFDSLEEFLQNMKTQPVAEKRMSFNEAMEAAKSLPADPAEEVGTKFGAVPAEPVREEAPAKVEAPAAEAPSYVLTDVQKAVRDVVKAKGKEAAKFVLEKFQHKDKPGSPATGASALRPEDYAEAIKALTEVLNA